MILWSAAGLSLLAGLLLTARSLGGLDRTLEILSRKAADAGELAGLRKQAVRHQALLEATTRYPDTPQGLETLARATLPGQAMRILTTDLSPSVPGWTARKVSVEFNDIAGSDLGRLLDAGAAATPPWTLLECTLLASPTPGRIAKATLVLVTAERSPNRP
jgi:hypothetical protein